MPSTFEKIGLPIIEAMACGTPVVTSARCATEEAAGGHAVLVDPWSIESIADGLRRVLETTDEQRCASRRHATTRDWSDVAVETSRIYCDVITVSESADMRGEIERDAKGRQPSGA